MNWEKAERYVGLPWEPGAAGPDAFDCWQLCVDAARELYGLEFPDVPYTEVTPEVVGEKATEQIGNGTWQRIDAPEPGAVIALSFPVPGSVTHVGLMLEGNMVLHSERRAGASINPMHAVASVFYVEGIYKWLQRCA